MMMLLYEMDACSGVERYITCCVPCRPKQGLFKNPKVPFFIGTDKSNRRYPQKQPGIYVCEHPLIKIRRLSFLNLLLPLHL